MEGSIALSERECKQLVGIYHKHADPEVRRRAHMILLLNRGMTWAMIASILYCSSRTIARWRKHYLREGVDGLCVERRGRPRQFHPFWIDHVRRWVLALTPRDFGFIRSRWCCRLIVVLLLEMHQLQVSEETVRRWLHRAGLVWRRPRPVVGRQDPQRERKIAAIRRLLANLPPDEVAVFQDEVDIDHNPKLGPMWMIRGEQAKVETPGNNRKRYLAGSLNWRTGRLIATEGTRRNSTLFIEHLEQLRQHLRCYRKIHVICDHARFHDCRAVWSYLADHDDRIELHFLPKYAPESNPIERIWWKLHEEITRNHRCQTLEELLDLVFAWLDGREPLEVEDDIYFTKAA